MSAYFILSFDVTDPEGFKAYDTAKVGQLLEKHGGTVLFKDKEVKSLEGDAPATINVALRFESEEAALGWYNDPEYEPLKQIRLNTTSGHAFIAK